MKGVGPLITAVLAAAFVSLFTEAGFVQSFFTDFLSGVTSMVGNMFFLLVLGAIFGGVLSATGASEKIGTTFVRVMGPTNFLYALIAATMLLAATGAVPYVLMAYISFGRDARRKPAPLHRHGRRVRHDGPVSERAARTKRDYPYC